MIDTDTRAHVSRTALQPESPGMFVAIVAGIVITIALFGASLILGA